MKFFSIFLIFFVSANDIQIEKSQNEVRIVLFTFCLRSHLRSMTSIAQELALTKSNKVTLVINSECANFLRSQNYDFNIDVIRSSIDNWNDTLSWYNIGNYMAEYEKDILDIYIPKWIDSKMQPDIVISEFSSFAGRDLSEIYNLKSVVVAPSIDFLMCFYYEDFAPQYLKFIAPTIVYQATDNILVRALRYIPKLIAKNLMWFIVNRESNNVREKCGLSSIRNSELNSFYIVESFFGLQDALLLPPYIELVGLLENHYFNNPMDPEMRSWINNSKGIIYISTGSIFVLTDEQQEALNALFTLLDYDFLISSKILKKKLKNVKIAKWVNQLELFQSNKVLVFITHGGHASIIESIQNSIPILCVPHDADQYANCDAVEQKNTGKTVFQDNFNPENLKKIIIELTTENKYKEGLQHMKSIINTYKGKKRAAEIINGLVQTGFDHLIPRWKHLPWYQKNELDIFIVYFIIIWVIYNCIKKCWTRKNKIKKD